MKYNRQAFCDASDKDKISLIKSEMDLETHNGTTKEYLLMFIEWLYYRAVKKDLD